MAERRRKCRAVRVLRARPKSTERPLADLPSDAAADADAKSVAPRRNLSKTRRKKPSGRKKRNVSRTLRIELQKDSHITQNKCTSNSIQNRKPPNEVDESVLNLTREENTSNTPGSLWLRSPERCAGPTTLTSTPSTVTSGSSSSFIPEITNPVQFPSPQGHYHQHHQQHRHPASYHPYFPNRRHGHQIATGGRLLSLNEVTDQGSSLGRRSGIYPSEQSYQPTFDPSHHHHYHPSAESTEPNLTPHYPTMPPAVHSGSIPFPQYAPNVPYYKEQNIRTASQERYDSPLNYTGPRPSYHELSCRTAQHYSSSQTSSPRFVRPSVPEVSSTSSLQPIGQYEYEEKRMVCTPDEDGDLPIHIAVVKEHLKEVRCLIHIMKKYQIHVDKFNNLRQTPLHIAVLVSNIEIMNLLLEAGASPCAPDRRGNTAVHLAAKCTNRHCLESLLENIQSEEVINAHNYDGFTPLHLAVLKNDRDLIRVLLCKGADVDIVDGTSGRGPLFHAIENGFADVVELLLSFGANVNLPNYSGVTPLVVATDKGNKQISSMLISRGAMITLRDDYS